MMEQIEDGLRAGQGNEQPGSFSLVFFFWEGKFPTRPEGLLLNVIELEEIEFGRRMRILDSGWSKLLLTCWPRRLLSLVDLLTCPT